MTLNITVLSNSLVSLSSDFRLTYEGLRSHTDHEAQKIVLVWSFKFSSLVQFCGLAKIGSFDTSEWLANIAKEFPREGSKAELVRTLMSAEKFANGHGLTFTIAGFESGKRFAYVVSNYDHVDPTQVRTKPGPFRCSSPGQGVCAFVTGQTGFVRPDELRILKKLIRGGASPNTLDAKLADLNANAAVRAGPNGEISMECFTGHLTAQGKGEVRPHGIPRDREYLPTFALTQYTRGGLTLAAKRDEFGNPLPRRFVAMSIKSGYDEAVGGLGPVFLTLAIFENIEKPKRRDSKSEDITNPGSGMSLIGWQKVVGKGVPTTISLEVTRGPIRKQDDGQVDPG